MLGRFKIAMLGVRKFNVFLQPCLDIDSIGLFKHTTETTVDNHGKNEDKKSGETIMTRKADSLRKQTKTVDFSLGIYQSRKQKG